MMESITQGEELPLVDDGPERVMKLKTSHCPGCTTSLLTQSSFNTEKL